ncbi:NOG1 family protein [Natrinema limicola]|uniref:Small GTP-binding protein n=1 Tax=Natrinema limicola JCM 13563 TaxID=1230457 RepID=M0CIX2_9EURY|nr:GTPase [Natrinema limicola]ELZ23240.1 small GTP-binding protein [Natrinema limicola JCM 13563]
MIFEDLPTTPTSEELIDKAFSRAARAGKAKGGLEAQQSMLQTAANIISDNLENVVTAWPDFEYDAHSFYYELADAIVDVDKLRQALSEVMWASRKAREIHEEYQPRLRKTDVDTARKHRKQAFARLADIVEQIDDHLLYINKSRNDLRDLPDIDPDEPTIVVAGYPNVGKSSFVNDVTSARGETASYPFTTVSYTHLESQAVSAIEHLADCMLVMVDPTGECGYPIGSQLELRDSIAAQFEDVPVLTVANKADRFEADDLDNAVAADYTMSVTTDSNVETVLEAAVEAIGYEPELPFDG